MGKKCKRKVQWRRLSLNELQSKISDEECDDEEDKEKQSSFAPPPPPPPDSRHHSSIPRRPFHPNFHSGDQRRYSPHFDQRGPSFERGPSLERSPYPRFFSRPYHHHHHHDNRPQFPGQRRRPYKFFGRGGYFVSGPSPYAGDSGPRRRWSDDDSLALEEAMGRVGGEDDVEDEDKPSQPVHTVFIGNEEYTKIQTPRQEVIFKKSSLDKKRDSIDLGSAPSTCGSVNGHDPSSQCDQASLTGSIEDTVMSTGEDPSLDNIKEGGPYEDTNNMFVEEPGNPPLLGVVMQQAYPGGPMISIPVHWTPFLNPGLIPGDTALTPLDPAFTHVIDPKDLPVDPVHILPVQHDSNGCPVTVQVKVNADGRPVEIEPSAFTVSLSTLEAHQQEALLRQSSDLLSGTPGQTPEEASRLHEKHLNTKEVSADSKVNDEASNEINEESEESRRGVHEQGEDFSSDSQYATMSEASTTPTTPSGELCDPSETADSSIKRNHDVQKEERICRSDSLLDSESYEPDENELSSYHPLNSLEVKDENCSYDTTDSICSQENIALPPETCSTRDSITVATNSILTSNNDPSNSDVTNKSFSLSDKNEGSSTKKSRKKKSRSISIDSTVSSQNSLADISQNNKDPDGEALSKYQVKKIARKLKKEKRSTKEKSKNKHNSSLKDIQKFEVEHKNSNVDQPSNETGEHTENSEVLEQVEKDLESTLNDFVEMEKVEQDVLPASRNEDHVEEEDARNNLSPAKKDEVHVEEEHINKEDTRQEKDNEEILIENVNERKDTTETNANEESNKTVNENEVEPEEQEYKSKNEQSSTQRDDESFTCKPGYVMVPILTPYYDPAVLYGYPVIIPENPPERNYGRKKKRKFKRRNHEEIYLDTELYAGEPFVATPNGYVVPVDAAQICQIHGYQYLPNVFPHILPDEGFGSVEHSSYLPEYFSDPAYHKLQAALESEKANRRVPNLYVEAEERKPVEGGKVLEQVQREEKLPKDHAESCDSGVSESEELVHLNLSKGEKVVTESNEKNEESVKKSKENNTSSKSGKQNDKLEEENKSSDGKKEGKKKKKHSKKKKEIIEILEPDFASFESPTPRFEVCRDDERNKPKVNKKLKKKKRQDTNQLQNKNRDITELTFLNNIDDKTENTKIKDEEVTSNACSESGKASPQLENKIKKDSKNKESKKQNFKTKNKSQKVNDRRTKSLVEDIRTQQQITKAVAKLETDISSATECLLENNFIEEACERDDLPSELEDTITLKEDENSTNMHSVNMPEVLSQESGIGAESEESLTYFENYDSSTTQEDKDQVEINLVQESFKQLDTNVQTEKETNEQLTNFNNPSSLKELPEEAILRSCDNGDCSIKDSEKSLENSLLEFEEFDNLLTVEESVPSERDDSLLVQTISPLTLAQSETFSSDSLLPVSSSIYAETETIGDPIVVSETRSTSLIEASQCASFKDLGVTEAVRRWIREVTPEKAFALSDETRHILFPNAGASGDDDIFEESEEELDVTDRLNDESKNVLGNPFVASPSKKSLVASGERVASRASFPSEALQGVTAPQKLRRRTSSQDAFDDFDGESELSSLAWSRMNSSGSSSSFPFIPSTEDPTTLSDDPRVYDPSVYSKYYQLSADVQVTSSTPSTRESTLSPSLVESEDVDLFTEDGVTSPTPTDDRHAFSIAAELLKSEKIRANMAHISPSYCDNTLPMPLCGSLSPYLLEQLDQNRVLDEGVTEAVDLSCSVSSSGIGSSLASTPNLTPAHQFSSSNSKPKLESHPLKNLSVGEGPLPCRTMCCSIM